MKKKLLLGIISSFLLAGALMGCENTDSSGEYYTVSFGSNTTLKTNNLLSQQVGKGKKIKKPSLSVTGDNPDNYKVYSWHTVATNQTEDNAWNFKKDVVNNDLTLYANWKKTYTVNYIVKGSVVDSVTVFDGEKVQDHPEYVVGFDYYGSYTESTYQNQFNFDDPVTSNLNLYLKQSESISIYEGNPSGGLFENLEVFQGTNLANTPEEPEVGTISRVKKSEGEGYEGVLIDFGYSPDIPDPFFELNFNFDISKSQYLYFRCKYYGHATSFCFYFTTVLDTEKYTPTITGANYTEDFNYKYDLKENEREMSETDDYVDMKIDLASFMKYGYSVWGTSPYLGKLRVQASYKSTSKADRSNKMLLQKIYGAPYEGGVITDDSSEIKALLVDDQNITSQTENPTGFVFPRDYANVQNSTYTTTYKKNTGLLMHFTNEIEMRKHDNAYQSVRFTYQNNGPLVTDTKKVRLNDIKTLKITLQNKGFGTSLDVVILTEYGGEVYTTLSLDQRQTSAKTYTVNLAKKSLIKNNLIGFEFKYKAVGTDNVIIVKEAYFTETRPYDIPGISFNDTQCFSLNDGSNGTDAEVTYDKSYSGTEVYVKQSGATLESTKNDISMTNLGYYSLSLESLLKDNTSNISKIYVSLKVNGAYGKEYEFTPSTELNSAQTVDLDVSEGGTVTNVKFRFVGTGTVIINALRFVVSDTYCFNMAKNIKKAFYSDWVSNASLSYDDAIEATTYTPDLSKADNRFACYLGIGNRWYGDNVYNCKNFPLEGKSKVVVVYNNPSSVSEFKNYFQFSTAIDGNPDDADNPVLDHHETTLKTKMGEYEWDAVTFNLPSGYTNASNFLGKFSFQTKATLNFRMVAVI